MRYRSPIRPRKTAGLALACALLLSVTPSAGQADRPIHTLVDGTLILFKDVQPAMVNARVMVPVRGVFEHFEAYVTWDEATRTVHAERGEDRLSLPLNSKTATKNGVQISLDTPAMVYRGRTMVPLRFLSEALGARVEWNAAQNTVAISTTPPASAWVNPLTG